MLSLLFTVYIAVTDSFVPGAVAAEAAKLQLHEAMHCLLALAFIDAGWMEIGLRQALKAVKANVPLSSK